MRDLNLPWLCLVPSAFEKKVGWAESSKPRNSMLRFNHSHPTLSLKGEGVTRSPHSRKGDGAPKNPLSLEGRG